MDVCKTEPSFNTGTNKFFSSTRISKTYNLPAFTKRIKSKLYPIARIFWTSLVQNQIVIIRRLKIIWDQLWCYLK